MENMWPGFIETYLSQSARANLNVKGTQTATIVHLTHTCWYDEKLVVGSWLPDLDRKHQIKQSRPSQRPVCFYSGSKDYKNKFYTWLLIVGDSFAKMFINFMGMTNEMIGGRRGEPRSFKWRWWALESTLVRTSPGQSTPPSWIKKHHSCFSCRQRS